LIAQIELLQYLKIITRKYLIGLKKKTRLFFVFSNKMVVTRCRKKSSEANLNELFPGA